jgi:hypothetical protein
MGEEFPCFSDARRRNHDDAFFGVEDIAIALSSLEMRKLSPAGRVVCAPDLTGICRFSGVQFSQHSQSFLYKRPDGETEDGSGKRIPLGGPFRTPNIISVAHPELRRGSIGIEKEGCCIFMNHLSLEQGSGSVLSIECVVCFKELSKIVRYSAQSAVKNSPTPLRTPLLTTLSLVRTWDKVERRASETSARARARTGMRLLGSRAKIGLAAVAVSCDALSWHFGCEGRRRKPALAEAATGGSSIPGDGAPFNSGGAGAGAGAGAGNGRPQHHPAAPHRAMMLARQNTARPRRSFYPYVIIGAGTTAHAAIEGILYHDPKADILMLTHEASLPRLDVKERERPIPKDLMASYNEWRRHIFCRLENEPGAFSSVPITLLLGRKRLCIDPERRMLTLDDGSEIEFNRCLIATAGKPRKFYVIDSDRSAALARDRLNVLGSLEDFQALQFVHESLPNGTAAVVGGGFLGTEVALALARRGVKVRKFYCEFSKGTCELIRIYFPPPCRCRRFMLKWLL